LCETLGLPLGSAFPAYEDAAYFALVEQKLPLDASPGQSMLMDPAERERLVRVFAQGLETPVGYVLPLLLTRTKDGKRRFVTERWAFRRGHLFLIPGDSPIGLRLPLTGLSEISFVDYPHVQPADPFADSRRLPPAHDLLTDCQRSTVEPTTEGNAVRTALA